MDNRLIITKWKQFIVQGLYREHELLEVNLEQEEAGILNNIYVGRVKNIVKNIQAVFVEIADGMITYLSMEDANNPVFINSAREGQLTVGDELLIQVVKEQLKTKDPVVTANITFTGKYLVLTSGNRRLGISTKIPAKEREHLKEKIQPFITEQYGFIVRTNAAEAAFEILEREAEGLIAQYEKIVQTAKYRTCFSKLYESPRQYLTGMRDVYQQNSMRIITDDAALYAQCKEYLENNQPEDLHKLSLYEDALLPLHKLYSLETQLENALQKRVWLKSGGYLVIEPTEALVVIDVNTGKYSGKKNQQETFLKINLEAAKEISKQLRLRNLSGIIIVDFINMDRENANEELLRTFQRYLIQDPMKTTLFGMTSLKLVELTRKKVKKPLYQQMAFR